MISSFIMLYFRSRSSVLISSFSRNRRTFSSHSVLFSRNASCLAVDSDVGHKAVLVDEVLDLLRPQPKQIILDMTFGAGGHTKSVLGHCSDVTIYALDRDPVAYNLAQKLSNECTQVIPLHGKFSHIMHLLSPHGIYRKVDAVLFDFGASSMQFDSAERGFSISQNGLLDMRMDGNQGQMSAADVVNYLSEDGLCQVIKKYGEEKRARLIARAIVDSRNTYGKITTTAQLAGIVADVYKGFSVDHKTDRLGRPSHVATKTFQAIRIFVNDELNELYNGLELACRLLRPGGICAAISFHSLEDRIVKRHFHGIDMDEHGNMSVSDRHRDPSVTHRKAELERLLIRRWEPVLRHPVTATEAEIRVNPRARSAKLRAAIRSD